MIFTFHGEIDRSGVEANSNAVGLLGLTTPSVLGRSALSAKLENRGGDGNVIMLMTRLSTRL